MEYVQRIQSLHRTCKTTQQLYDLSGASDFMDLIIQVQLIPDVHMTVCNYSYVVLNMLHCNKESSKDNEQHSLRNHHKQLHFEQATGLHVLTSQRDATPTGTYTVVTGDFWN